MNEVIKPWHEEYGQSVRDWALDIWRNPEISMEEYRTCKLTAAIMKQHSFSAEVFNCKESSLHPNTVACKLGSTAGCRRQFEAADARRT
ncbi:MAG: M20 family metallopeptidase [Ruminococcaceae bacterium]|nr:M20 family metallopeptidase [Oscillospiraceae bacterium]